MKVSRLVFVLVLALPPAATVAGAAGPGPSPAPAAAPAPATAPAPVRAPSPTPAAGAAPAPAEAAVIEVVVRDGRYQPADVVVKAGEPVRLRFVRQEWSGCTREVVFPTLGIRRELPPEQPVTVELPALPVGETPFQCGMGMVHGKVVVEAR